MNQIVQKQSEERDRGKGNAEPEHSGSDGKHRQPNRHDRRFIHPPPPRPFASRNIAYHWVSEIELIPVEQRPTP